MKRCVILVVGVVVACSALFRAQGAAPGADPILGTWKANLAKSTYSPGPPPPAYAGQLRRYTAADSGMTLLVLTSVNQDGDPTFQITSYKTDGRQHPVHSAATMTTLLTTGKTTNVMRSYRRIDAWSTEFITYTDGVASIPSVRTVSKDGKTFTEVTKGTNGRGQAVNNVVVFERVR